MSCYALFYLGNDQLTLRALVFFLKNKNKKHFYFNILKGYRLSIFFFFFFFLLKVANIPCFILIAVEIFHNIIRK